MDVLVERLSSLRRPRRGGYRLTLHRIDLPRIAGPARRLLALSLALVVGALVGVGVISVGYQVLGLRPSSKDWNPRETQPAPRLAFSELPLPALCSRLGPIGGATF